MIADAEVAAVLAARHRTLELAEAETVKHELEAQAEVAALKAKNQALVDEAVAAGLQALGSAKPLIEGADTLIARLDAVLGELESLCRTVSIGFERENWAMGVGLVKRPTPGLGSKLPISAGKASEVVKLGFRLGRISGVSATNLRNRAAQL